jgi:hypothetical protein
MSDVVQESLFDFLLKRTIDNFRLRVDSQNAWTARDPRSRPSSREAYEHAYRKSMTHVCEQGLINYWRDCRGRIPQVFLDAVEAAVPLSTLVEYPYSYRDV